MVVLLLANSSCATEGAGSGATATVTRDTSVEDDASTETSAVATTETVSEDTAATGTTMAVGGRVARSMCTGVQ
jgi:hypothetical protein